MMTGRQLVHPIVLCPLNHVKRNQVARHDGRNSLVWPFIDNRENGRLVRIHQVYQLLGASETSGGMTSNSDSTIRIARVSVLEKRGTAWSRFKLIACSILFRTDHRLKRVYQCR